MNDDDDLFVQACISWVAVKTDDINAVAECLELEEVEEGDFTAWGYDSSPNTFLYVAQDQWVIVYHRWQHTGELEPSAADEEIRNAVYTADVNLLNRLSERFGVAQSFGFDEEYVGYAHWALSEHGNLIRYFKWSSEDEEPNQSFNIGAPTEAELFIDWATLNDWELVEEDDESYYEYNGESFGCIQVLKVAQQWSLNPVHDEEPGNRTGLLGDGKVAIS
jgi:hypothetical protein